jgi:hypothetical protein
LISQRCAESQQPSTVQIEKGPQQRWSAGQTYRPSEHWHWQASGRKTAPFGHTAFTHSCLVEQYCVPSGGFWQMQALLGSSSQPFSHGGSHSPLQQVNPAAQVSRQTYLPVAVFHRGS